jgi:Cytidylate kinase-like family
MSHPVICISRAWGAGGEEVGRLVASRLGLLFVDEEIIALAAARGGVDPGRVIDQERRKSMIARWLEYLGEAGAPLDGMPVNPVWNEPPSEVVRELIREAIHEVAERGNVVIVAHAASQAVGAGPGVLRVLITGSPETRSRRLAEADGRTIEEASKTIDTSDAARADYLKRFYGIGQELPTHYDLVINTDLLSPGQASTLIVEAATARATGHPA